MDISRMARGLGTVVSGVVIGGAILFAQHTRAQASLAEGTDSNWDGRSTECFLPADPACAQRLARAAGPRLAPPVQEDAEPASAASHEDSPSVPVQTQ